MHMWEFSKLIKEYFLSFKKAFIATAEHYWVRPQVFNSFYAYHPILRIDLTSSYMQYFLQAEMKPETFEWIL